MSTASPTHPLGRAEKGQPCWRVIGSRRKIAGRETLPSVRSWLAVAVARRTAAASAIGTSSVAANGRNRPPTSPDPRRYWQRNSTVARASLPGAASVPGVASFSLEVITTADLLRRSQYASASSTRRAFSSAPLKCPDEPVTQNAPSRAGMTNDLDPHPVNATAARQIAKRKDTVRSPLSDMGSLVRTADPDEQPGSGHGRPGLNLQERKVHLIGPLAIEDGPCRERGPRRPPNSRNAAPPNPAATG